MTLRRDTSENTAAVARCLLAAAHAPDDHQGVDAYVGALHLAEALRDIAIIRKALTGT